ncbi:MAG: glycosyl transferase family 1 [SAR86 cluster bacterium]|uniref:tRNA-queuosine alpha-mannosyltransferase n=1 Tax=SAR86 cluster bacterium TaxID=2030880 RepID=A0A2A4XAT9_9GAMM|nr:MAG: glycosyl transferase family 1 [SAR86 cluster bacterium]
MKKPTINYRILLLSAYDAMSHKMWRGRLIDMFPEHSWTQLALPPRHFNWRIRGNSLQWALNEKERLNQDYDLLIVTSMVDLASLRGFIPRIAQLPTLLYFHENQFVYPLGSTQRSNNVEPQLVPLYSALCADAIAFNSDYNRSTFLQGAKELLKKLPDPLSPELLERIEKSEVIPVPIEEFPLEPVTPAIPTAKSPKQILDVIWNHRWEYDKGPKLLLRLAEAILAQRLPIRLHVVGQQFRSSPAEFEKIASLLEQHAAALSIDQGSFGFVENRESYIDLLRRCDVVLSTALHDFQGLAIQEACTLGCTPLVPDALVYPEYIDSEFLYPFNEHCNESDGSEANCAGILHQLENWQKMLAKSIALPRITLEGFSQKTLRPKYAELLERLVSRP